MLNIFRRLAGVMVPAALFSSALVASVICAPPLRAATTGVDPVDAATQLMDYGERAFPQYFPKHRQNQALPPYLYRYYPETGVYLGVADGKVYVLGGPWADVTLVGELTSFIAPVRSSGTLGTLSLPGFPHKVTVYRPDAAATRAIVYLHGGGGTSGGLAYSLGLNSVKSEPGAETAATANWPWLVSNRTIAIFPQGEHIAAAPLGATWTNHAMISGENDLAFLQALAAYIKSNYGVSDVVLAGHSMGGAMTQRMWCESSSTFSAYISMAGPASSHYLDSKTPCAPGANPPPYLGLFAGSDEVMQNTGLWEAPTWQVSSSLASSPAFINSVMIGEWSQHVRRAQLMCGQSALISDKSRAGNVDSWNHCGGKLQLKEALQAHHAVDSIQDGMGAPLINLMADFLDR